VPPSLLARADAVIEQAATSVPGAFRKCRNVQLESGMRSKADVTRPLEPGRC
jgi:hypothetical protein